MNKSMPHNQGNPYETMTPASNTNIPDEISRGQVPQYYDDPNICRSKCKQLIRITRLIPNLYSSWLHNKI